MSVYNYTNVGKSVLFYHKQKAPLLGRRNDFERLLEIRYDIVDVFYPNRHLYQTSR